MFVQAHSYLRHHDYLRYLGLVAEPARPAEAEAEAGCLSGPARLGGKIFGITSLVTTPAYNL